ncbi:MAG: PSD1 and planctomycete cytochrome C domain-containing protein [Planctomycetia bacterium]|nr:PSD1 and planctomycete cytochrome C domain-containing protein [Planctomycetia bacterium]
MKSCWLKLIVLLPFAWWLASCEFGEPSPSRVFDLALANAGDDTSETQQQADNIDYETQIKPIFAKHCIDCHKAEKNESGYQVDIATAAIKGGDRGAAVVPGKSDASLLFQALIGKGEVTAMPYEKPRLPAEQIELIKKWIDAGAKIPKSEVAGLGEQAKSNHWSFQPIKQPIVPNPKSQTLNSKFEVQNPIDAFILQRLEREGLTPSPAADRPTLIRRLSLDLLGLLPSPDEVEAFVRDDQPDAYEKLVDRLLASPHYGERFGRHWLDIARYADSNGFTIDSARQIWKYREWVIHALNADMPFDQFTIEQLAGDLLPNASTEQLVATGFHRNTLVNEEGGTDQEQFRVEAVVDRVSTTGAAWLGLTIGCAQCHAHKYDPISQRDFYQVFAVFNQCDEPSVPVPSPDQLAEQKRLDTEVADAEKPLKDFDAELLKGLPDWEKSVTAQSAGGWTILDPTVWKTDKGATLTKIDGTTLLVDFSTPANDVYTVTLELPAEALSNSSTITAIRLETLNHASLPMMGPGRAEGNFVLSEFELLTESAAQPSTLNPQPIARAIADHSQEGYPISDAIDGKPKTGWAINVKPNSGEMLNVPREAVFFPKEPINAKPGMKLVIKMHQLHSVPNYLVGCFRISISGASADVLSVPASIRKIIATPTDKRTKPQIAQLETAFKNTDPRRKPLADRLDGLKKQLDALNKAIPTTLVLRTTAKPRETHIHIRGDFLRKGTAVEPGIPAVLDRRMGTPARPAFDSFPKESGKSAQPPAARLAFAKWLVSNDNPLTARVTVNRAWQAFFGTGLVPTENDFGTQGDLPSHPELLDWLASELMGGEGEKVSDGISNLKSQTPNPAWSLKRLHRLIVTSATYRQASHVRPELRERDPSNKLLGRQSRIRLEAELIRDVCLSASGLLTRQLGGPGVHPPQPEGIYIVTQQKKAWPESTGPDRFRRGMYTYFWRSSPYPMLPTFDAPDANGVCTRRNRSNTPLQALTLANDRSFHEFAIGLADRIMATGPLPPTPLPSVADSDDARIWQAIEMCFSRPPSEAELRRLRDFLNRQRAAFATNPNEKDAPKSAWTALARVLMNLDEFITRE